MTADEYVESLSKRGCARGNKGVIQNKDGTTTLIYAVKGCRGDLYLAPDTSLTCDQRRAQYEAAIRQIDRLKNEAS